MSAVRELGIEPVDLGVVKDIEGDLEQRIKDSLQYDVVITSGGVSMGHFVPPCFSFSQSDRRKGLAQADTDKA
eukprot:m.181164 g.181164  ORF g.181164 m.181164 type:complete len:73 (-) comp18033_c0_seq1:497-715(-)